MSDSGRLRTRVYVDGVLIDEQWIDVLMPGLDDTVRLMTGRQNAIVEAAIDAGQRWQVEVWDPDLPGEHGYMRMGTDSQGMRAPIPLLSKEQIDADVDRRYGPGLN